MMNIRPVIDVAGLPASEIDHRSLVWWGNLLLIVIETMIFALLVSAYFYVRPNFTEWPPPRATGPLGVFDPVPALRVPTINLLLLLFTLVPMIVADRACLRHDVHAVRRALIGFLILAAVCVGLRFYEFRALHFRWDENAYASIVWTTIGLHLLHLVVGVLELLMMLAWILSHGLDDKHARDVRVTAVYWYWIVGTWLVLYAIMIIGPRYF